MNATTLILAVSGTAIGSTSASVKEDGTLDTTKRNDFIATTLSVTATTVAGSVMNNATVDQIHHKYSRSYVESLSDSELEAALQDMNLLASENMSNNRDKTL